MPKTTQAKSAGPSSARPRRRTAAKEVRQQQLIRATLNAVAKKGFAETTMADVAREAHLSQGIINLHFRSKDNEPMKTLTIAVLTLVTITAASAQNQTTFRDASGRTTGTVTTDSNGTKTFRDGSGRTTGTATTNSNGTTTFRDAGGRTTGTASTPRR